MNLLEIVDKMTGREVAAVEDAAGLSIASLTDDAAPKLKLMAAMVWQLRSREEPKLKLGEVLDQTSVQIMRDLERFDPPEEDADAERFPVDDDTSGVGRGEGAAEGAVLSGDGDPTV